jgi:predicted nicotinamide N-methyase
MVAKPRRRHLDPVEFIREHMPLAPVPLLPGICLHRAQPSSGLWRLAEGDPDFGAPYWAYAWAGGLALARHFADHPETVAGRRVLDLGAGSGLVAIAAAKAGAREVLAAETNRYGVAALGLNGAANDVVLSVIAEDLTAGPAPDVDLIAVGDLFYAQDLADRVTAFLDRCIAANVAVLVGDPGRAFLPRSRLRLVADYAVADFGEGEQASGGRSAVFAFEPAA